MFDYHYKKHDVVITTNDKKEIHFYKDILCEESKVFVGMFAHNMKEKQENKIRLDYSYDDLISFLNMIHPSLEHTLLHFHSIRDDNVFKMLKMAHEYQITKIINSCLEAIETRYTKEKDLKNLINTILKLRQCIQIYEVDIDLRSKLTTINDKLIERLSTFEFDLNDELLNKLPKEILITIIGGFNKKGKKFVDAMHELPKTTSYYNEREITVAMKKAFDDCSIKWIDVSSPAKVPFALPKSF
jgi:hypothetical protein